MHPDQTKRHEIAGAEVIDAGVAVAGSISAGLTLAKMSAGHRLDVTLAPADAAMPVDWAVAVRTDEPATACLGYQYAGWPLSHDGYLAMASGEIRVHRGREPLLQELNVPVDRDAQTVGGVLESDKLPTAGVIAEIAQQCGVLPGRLSLAVAPAASLAGSIQVIARSVETAMHKLHELKFPVSKVVSAAGTAPLLPPAQQGDIVGGIGRTNDAILYGGRVTMWVAEADEAIAELIDRVPSGSSSDHGRPFAETFAAAGHDFYQIDPLLFSPAVITMHSLTSGKTWRAGSVDLAVMAASMGGG